MSPLIGSIGFRLAQPMWLAAALVALPLIAWSWRKLESLGRVRRAVAIGFRTAVLGLLAVLLAQPRLERTSDQLTVILVIDRSQSVPDSLREDALAYLGKALKDIPEDARIAVVDTAEIADISKLPSRDPNVRRRIHSVRGKQTNLAAGVEMAMAIAPPDSATRIVLVSDGNENAGELRDAARVAASNGIPVDVLALQYDYPQEVVFRRIVVPSRARSGQTVNLRMVLNSTSMATGRLQLTLNGQRVDLDPSSPSDSVPVTLRPGTNVKSVQVPLGARGVHDFEARFIPDGQAGDTLLENNLASGVTYVAGPGHVLLVDANGTDSMDLSKALRASDMDIRYLHASEFPESLPDLMDTDCVVLVNTPADYFTARQQQLLHLYVSRMGGGMVMVGGPEGFGAGGWIGSPVATILPVDLDPPQRKEMPRGALVLVIDRSSSMAGEKLRVAKRAALAAVRGLSKHDDVGVVVFDTGAEWAVPLQRAENRKQIESRIRQISLGGGTDVHAGMLKAAQVLKNHDGGTRHVILLSDGQTAGPPCQQLATQMDRDRITVSTVAVGAGADRALLMDIAKRAKGRFYPVDDPRMLPQIFVKEARTVRRSLIREGTFTPAITDPTSELVPPGGLPALDGYIVTATKGGFNKVLLVSDKKDPVLASGQAGLGRCVAFTSSGNALWAKNWVSWGGFARFWEQIVRHTGKSPQGMDADVYTEVSGRDVVVTVDAVDREGNFMQFADVAGNVIDPTMETEGLELRQIGPGQYRTQFRVSKQGSYLLNLRYRRPDGTTGTVQSAVAVPYALEFNDLADNTPLLHEVTVVTNGRQLPAEPADANLFATEGLAWPKHSSPLTELVLMLLAGLFLLDVAVRRISVDVVGMARSVRRRVGGMLGSKSDTDQTLARLKARRDQIKKTRLASSGQASRKFVAGEQASAGPLPLADTSKAPDKADRRPGRSQDTDKKPDAPVLKEQSHVDRLLAARRKRDKGQGGT